MPLIGEKWILLGASRGLGLAFAKKSLAMESSQSLVVVSRKIEKGHFNIPAEKWTADFTDESQWNLLLEKILAAGPSRIFYFAGGGPYGDFDTKAWKDHLWAYRLNFLFPAFLLHTAILSAKNLRQIVYIGSAIAEDTPDPGAASYSAAKHSLKGLVTSVQKEIQAEQKSLDLRLYSPGYMNTDLLPPDAWPRQQQGLVLETDKVANDLWQWSMNQHDANTHRLFPEKSLLK